MNGKNLAKTIVKFAAIVLGVFILSQAVSAKSYSFNLSYSGGSYCSYCSVGYSYSDDYYEPGYYSDSYYYDYAPAYYQPVVSYDYYYPPLYTYGNYYANTAGGYPFGGYYTTYSPYDNSFYSPVMPYYGNYGAYYYATYPGFIVYN